MSKEQQTGKTGAIKRILVALDASTDSLAALEAAANMAAVFQAELIGLFVEDLNLLHLAGLPFAHEVKAASASNQPVDSGEMEHQLRLLASQARRALQRAAERARVTYSFSVVRGKVTESVLAAALDADLLAMGRVSRPVSSKTRLGSTTRAATSAGRGSLLIMQEGSTINYPILVTYDGSPEARQGLLAAVQLIDAGGDRLTVLLVADSEAEATHLQQEADAELKTHTLRADYYRLPQAEPDHLIHIVKATTGCVLILSGSNPLLKAEAIQQLLDETDCPVMLVR